MNLIRNVRLSLTSGWNKLLGLLMFIGFVALPSASAQTFTGAEMDTAETVAGGFIAVGVAIAILFAVFKIGRRATNKV